VLAITKKLADLHGGELTIVSAKETGTTVTLKLPKVANG
jgi:signal transduction histidine kinase